VLRVYLEDSLESVARGGEVALDLRQLAELLQAQSVARVVGENAADVRFGVGELPALAAYARALEECAREFRVQLQRRVNELPRVVPAVYLDERERAAGERHRAVGLVELRHARERVGRERELAVVEEGDAVVVPATPVR